MSTGKSVQHLQNITINDIWFTPDDLFKQGVEIAGFEPKLDVCASYPYQKCFKFFSLEEDGLLPENKWNWDFFMNPPYSQVKHWIRKAYEQHIINNKNALILTYSKTDTKWWHEYVEGKAEVHFIKGRVRFVLPPFRVGCVWMYNQVSKNPAPYPSCWIIYRRKS